MDDYDKRLLLLNAVKVAHADNLRSPAEEAVLEELRKEVKATKTLFKRVQVDVSEHQVDLLALPRFSTRIFSLETMCEVALADGDIEENELALIRVAGHSAGLADEQISRIVDECLLRTETSARHCASCGASLKSDAAFCSSCGAKAGDSSKDTSTRVDLSIPSKGVTIAFANSSAAGFTKALNVAKSRSSFQEAERGRTSWYAVTFNREESQGLIDVAEPISTIRNKEVYVDGSQADWRDTLAFVRCASERSSAYNGVQYCFGLSDHQRLNVWGCKCLDMDWAGWSNWFTYGEFKRKDVFQFDRDRIWHELNAGVKSVGLCPHFRSKFYIEAFRRIPEKVKVSIDGPWEYRQSYDESDPRGIEVTVVRDYGDGYKSKEKFMAVGVQPKDPNLPVEIILGAAKASGDKDVSRSSLGI